MSALTPTPALADLASRDFMSMSRTDMGAHRMPFTPPASPSGVGSRIDFAVGQVFARLDEISCQVEVLDARVTGDHPVISTAAVSKEAALPSLAATMTHLFADSEPMTRAERKEFRDANRPFARPLGDLPKKSRPR